MFNFEFSHANRHPGVSRDPVKIEPRLDPGLRRDDGLCRKFASLKMSSLLTILFSILCLLAGSHLAYAASITDPNSQLKELDNKINSLQNANLQLSQAVELLNTYQHQSNQQKEQLSTLRLAQQKLVQKLAHLQSALSDELRLSYQMGYMQKSAPLKLLLNQDNPHAMARLLTYLDYFKEARTSQIATIQTTLIDIQNHEKNIQTQLEQIANQNTKIEQQLTLLESAKSNQVELLEAVESNIQLQDSQLQSLHIDKKSLETLTANLQKTTPLKSPLRAYSFDKARGKLDWPISGTHTTRNITSHTANNKPNGLFIRPNKADNTRAVFGGKVIYADWLKGFGLLIILDHGDHYFSLYAHNQNLYKTVGDTVTIGEPIGQIGRNDDLYFEIRHRGKPLDPIDWLKKV